MVSHCVYALQIALIVISYSLSFLEASTCPGEIQDCTDLVNFHIANSKELALFPFPSHFKFMYSTYTTS